MRSCTGYCRALTIASVLFKIKFIVGAVVERDCFTEGSKMSFLHRAMFRPRLCLQDFAQGQC
jgi:hypothetical protein